jgi:hypothetical protein
MQYLETSKDILNIVIAASVGSISFFICWGLFYMVMSGRKLYHMVKEAGDIVANLKEATRLIKEKVEFSASYFMLIGEGVKKILEMLKEKDKKRKKKEKEGKGE